MRQLNLLIKACSECPYYRFIEDNDYMYPVCLWRPNTPFALRGLSGGDWQEGIDDRCELTEYLDYDYDDAVTGRTTLDPIRTQGVEPDIFNSFNGLVNAVNGLPEDWLRDMTEEEREQFNRQEDERINRILVKQGFDIPSSHGVEHDEEQGS